jgi:uncharacterized membrane protein
VLAIGLVTWWPDVRARGSPGALALLALGPPLVAASLAAFAGEHFTAAAAIAQLVPKWLPGRLFIAYLVGVAHLAAALSIVTRRWMRWSGLGLAVMFGLFVLLMDLPGALARPTVRLTWILAARETTFAMGGLALLAVAIRQSAPRASATMATVARVWLAIVLVCYGLNHLVSPQYSPGVPDSALTASWVPSPLLLAYATGVLLIAFGVAMLATRYAGIAAACAGLVFLVLTIVLYVPQFFLAHTVPDRVTAINFVFDTLLFAGTVLTIGRATVGARQTID